MLKYQKNEVFGRVLRCDEPLEECGISSYDRLRDLIRQGATEESLRFLDYVQHEFKWLHDLYTDWTYADLDYIAKHYGEEELPKFLRYAKNHLDKLAYKGYGDIRPLDMLHLFSEGMRAHRCGPGETGTFKMFEDSERYVMEFDPCGSGGRMRRTGELDDLPPRTEALFNLGRTTKGYPWSWGKKGVPYYCLHCCIWHEQMPIEKTGIPIKITDYLDDPEAPCRWYFYKRPEDIPEEYYTRIGQTKPHI